MSEVRCPFCGNKNAADAEVCVVCGSRLQAVQNQTPEESEETPEWLANLRKKAQNEEKQSPPTPAFLSAEGLDEGEAPDWLQSLKDAAAEVNSDVSDTGEVTASEAPQPFEESPPKATPSPFVADDQSWLRDLAGVTQDEPQKPEADAEDSYSLDGPVDWARRLANEPIAQQQSDDEPDDSDDYPDPEENGEFLSRLQSWTSEPAALERQDEETPPASPPTFTIDAEEREEIEPETEETAPEPSDESGQPAVFIESEESISPPPFSEPVEELAESEPDLEGFPEWMKEQTGFEPPTGDEKTGEPPVFLNEDSDQSETEEEPVAEAMSPAPENGPVFLSEEEDEAEVSFDDEPDDEDQAPPFMLEDVPDWLSSYATELPDEELAEQPEPQVDFEAADSKIPFPAFEPEELTASHDTPTAEEEPAPAEGPAEVASESEDEELHRAQLPGWVEAMRPVESVLAADGVKPESEQRIERSGPLAGIPGTIPGEDLATRYHKPPVYSSKLQITEKQRLHANLLEAMIAETDEPAATGRGRQTRPSALPRLLVAVLMLAVLSYVLITGTPLLPLPNLYPAEAAAFQSTLQTIAESQQPVLVVVDYQPAFAAELESAASGPLQDLAEAGVGLALVSTNPTGPVLGSRLIDDLSTQNPAFSTADDAINLGYLAGGSTGMQALAQQPSRAVLSTFEGNDAWGSPLLSGMQSLDSFGGILILTDTVENGRDWIEQVQPTLANTPLLLIASAQSAPLLQPYVQSGQLGGMLSGWYGGVSYSIIANHPVDSQAITWSAYQVGIALMVVLILVGALIQGALSLISARNKNSGA